MLEPGGEPDLALEALGAERGGELGVEHLERDRPVVPEVAGEVDRGHARRGRARARTRSGLAGHRGAGATGSVMRFFGCRGCSKVRLKGPPGYCWPGTSRRGLTAT